LSDCRWGNHQGKFAKLKNPLFMHILLVDSSVPILNRLSADLGRQSGQNQIAIACTASEAYEELASQNFDLVIFDLFLPDDPAMKFLQILVRDYPMTVPVVYTSDLNSEIERSCKKMGCNFFYRKPQDHDKLISKIVKLSNRNS